MVDVPDPVTYGGTVSRETGAKLTRLVRRLGSDIRDNKSDNAENDQIGRNDRDRTRHKALQITSFEWMPDRSHKRVHQVRKKDREDHEKEELREARDYRLYPA